MQKCLCHGWLLHDFNVHAKSVTNLHGTNSEGGGLRHKRKKETESINRNLLLHKAAKHKILHCPTRRNVIFAFTLQIFEIRHDHATNLGKTCV